MSPSRRKLTLGERYYERSLFHYEANHVQQALSDLDQAIETEPKHAEYYVARGLMLLESERPDEAEEDFAYGLALDPKQWLAHYGRGIKAFNEADYTAAIGFFSRAQKLAQDRPEIYYYRAIALYLDGNSSEASEDMKFVQTLLDPEDKLYKDSEKWLSYFKK